MEERLILTLVCGLILMELHNLRYALCVIDRQIAGPRGAGLHAEFWKSQIDSGDAAKAYSPMR